MAAVTYRSAGSGLWLCPANVYAVTVACWGASGGGRQGQSPGGGTGGGGGEYASDTVAVTPGRLYRWTVGTAGSGGTGNGGSGGTSSFAGDAVTVQAHGGQGGGASPGAGGTGSANATHFNGGSGGGNGGFPDGGGGGSSAGPGGPGGSGGDATSGAGGAGGTPPAGGGAGGAGATGGFGIPGNGSAPGGGGGGGSGGHNTSGADGAPGQVQLTYAAATQPLVPFFPAGYPALPSDFDNWIQSPLSFLTSKVAFRAELTTASAMSSGGTTVLPFNSILEDPFSGWEPGSHQWLCPAGYTGAYEVAVTVSCAANPGTVSLQALAGLDSAATLYGLTAVTVPLSGGAAGIASGAVPVQLYGGQDTVQGLAIVTGGAGTTVSTAGQRCQLTITWQDQ